MSALPSNLLNHFPFVSHLLNTVQAGVAVLRPNIGLYQQVIDFDITYVNPVAKTIFGLDEHENSFPSYLNLFPSAKVIGLFDDFVQVLQTGQTYHNAELAYTWDGIRGWFAMQVSKFDDSLVMTFVEVTTLKQTQFEQQQAEFLEGLLQTSPSGIIVYQAIRRQEKAERQLGEPAETIDDFKVVFCNATYERIFLESAQDVHRHTFRQRFADESYVDLFPFYRELTQNGTSFREERYYPHLNKWLDVSGTRWHDGFLLVIDDVSERKEAETVQRYQSQELQLLNQELQRSNENLLEFSYVASHDLQEPLRKIQQFGDMLEHNFTDQLGEQGLDLLHRMQRASVRMSALIRDLLDYSRLASQSELFQEQDLNQVVEGVLIALELVIAETGAFINVGSLCTVLGDATQLAQLFQNLLTNAIKFNKPGNPPTISITCERIGVDTLPAQFDALSDSPSFHRIRVADEGIGFEPDQAERIFGAFQRLHGRGEYPGTGIGLAIARKVVMNHKGYIMAESQPGQGAVFSIYLPAINTTTLDRS
jgi:signal transduction histidine kinase